MFTVRVEERREAKVMSCAQYTEHMTPDGRKILTLYAESGPVDKQVPMATVAIGDGTRAWVMNENGKTVDTVRSRP